MQQLNVSGFKSWIVEYFETLRNAKVNTLVIFTIDILIVQGKKNQLKFLTSFINPQASIINTSLGISLYKHWKFPCRY